MASLTTLTVRALLQMESPFCGNAGSARPCCNSIFQFCLAFTPWNCPCFIFFLTFTFSLDSRACSCHHPRRSRVLLSPAWRQLDWSGRRTRALFVINQSKSHAWQSHRGQPLAYWYYSTMLKKNQHVGSFIVVHLHHSEQICAPLELNCTTILLCHKASQTTWLPITNSD